MMVDARAASLRLALAGLLMVPAAEAAIGQEQRTFSSPEATMAALLDALSAQDDAALLEIFGPEHGDEILGEDPDAGRDEQARFVAAADPGEPGPTDPQQRTVIVFFSETTGGLCGMWSLSPMMSCSVCVPGDSSTMVSVCPPPKCR
jgi:Protein of unknown function (DUF2950)